VPREATLTWYVEKRNWKK